MRWLTKRIAWKQFLGVQCARSPPGFTYMSLEQGTLHLHWFSGLKKVHTALTSFWKTINWTITGFTVGAEKYTKCLFVKPLHLQYLRLVEHCGMCDSYIHIVHVIYFEFLVSVTHAPVLSSSTTTLAIFAHSLIPWHCIPAFFSESHRNHST